MIFVPPMYGYSKNKVIRVENSTPMDASGVAFGETRQILAGIGSPKRVLLVAILSVAGFVLIINSSWNATPDSALYMTLGESLGRGEGYVFNGEKHTFVPPGFPLLLAGTSKLLAPSFLSYRILMAVMGFLTAVSAYFFVSRLAGPDCGFLVGGLFSLNHTLLYNSTFVLADVPFALFIMLSLNAVLSAARRNTLAWICIAGLICGILPLVRVNGAGFPLAAAFFFFCSWRYTKWWKKVSHITLFLMIAFTPIVVWQLWKSYFPVSESEGTYLYAIGGRTWQDQVTVMVSAFLSYFPEISFSLTGISLRTGILELIPTGIMFLGMSYAYRKGERLLVPLFLVQFCGLLLTTAGTRYIVFLIPAFYLFLAVGLGEISNLCQKRFPDFPSSRLLVIGCFAVLAVLNTGHNLITIVEARTALEKNGAQSERSQPFFSAARWLKQNAPSAVVLTTRPRIIHYLSGCRTVSLVRSGVPDHEIWVREDLRLREIIEKQKPDFLYADTKDTEFFNQIMSSMKLLGLDLEEIQEASTPRYRLFRIRMPNEL